MPACRVATVFILFALFLFGASRDCCSASRTTSRPADSSQAQAQDGIRLTRSAITGTWCGENEEPGTGCYTFHDDGSLDIECPMCFHGTWSISGNTISIKLESPAYGPAGEALEKITLSGTMTMRDRNTLAADFPAGDGSGHSYGASWILRRYKSVR